MSAILCTKIQIFPLAYELLIVEIINLQEQRYFKSKHHPQLHGRREKGEENYLDYFKF